MRNEGCIEPVVNFQTGRLWFKTVNTCQLKRQVKRHYDNLFPITGRYLENDSRGGKIRFYESKGGQWYISDFHVSF